MGVLRKISILLNIFAPLLNLLTMFFPVLCSNVCKMLEIMEIKMKIWVKLVHYVAQTPADIYLLKVNNRNTRTKCEVGSKLTINTQELCRLA